MSRGRSSPVSLNAFPRCGEISFKAFPSVFGFFEANLLIVLLGMISGNKSIASSAAVWSGMSTLEICTVESKQFEEIKHVKCENVRKFVVQYYVSKMIGLPEKSKHPQSPFDKALSTSVPGLCSTISAINFWNGTTTINKR